MSVAAIIFLFVSAIIFEKLATRRPKSDPTLGGRLVSRGRVRQVDVVAERQKFALLLEAYHDELRRAEAAAKRVDRLAMYRPVT